MFQPCPASAINSATTRKLSDDVRMNDQRHAASAGDHRQRSARTLSCARSEQAARAQQQHDDEHQEDADLAERFAEKKAGQAFHHADEQAADQRARHRAHAAEHDDGEGDQHEGVAHASD